MTRDVRVLTRISLSIPAIMFAAGLLTPPPARGVLLAVAGFVVVLYAAIRLAWRATRFEVDAGSLRIVWPLRTRAIARTAIAGARVATGAELRAEHGLGMRVGVGGLWGGFGLLVTRRTTFSMWISRTDRFVVVDVRGARPLLLTPENPERFVTALAA